MQSNRYPLATIGFKIKFRGNPLSSFTGIREVFPHSIFGQYFTGRGITAGGDLDFAVAIHITGAAAKAGQGTLALMTLFRWHGAVGVGGILFVGGQQALVFTAIDRGFYIEVIPVRLDFKPGIKAQYQLLGIYFSEVEVAPEEVMQIVALTCIDGIFALVFA